jgi:hypothetical protein
VSMHVGADPEPHPHRMMLGEAAAIRCVPGLGGRHCGLFRQVGRVRECCGGRCATYSDVGSGWGPADPARDSGGGQGR